MPIVSSGARAAPSTPRSHQSRRPGGPSRSPDAAGQTAVVAVLMNIGELFAGHVRSILERVVDEPPRRAIRRAARRAISHYSDPGDVVLDIAEASPGPLG